MSIAIKAAELMDRFQWLTTEEAGAAVEDPTELAAVTDELADIVIYCLSLSNALDLDVSLAVLGKLQTNEHRYPAGEFRGRFRKRNGALFVLRRLSIVPPSRRALPQLGFCSTICPGRLEPNREGV